MFRFDNLYTRRITLILIISFILLGGFGVSSIISYKTSKQMLKEHLLESDLPLLSDKIYLEIKSEISPYLVVSKRLASDFLLKEWVVGKLEDQTLLFQYLKDIQSEFDAATVFVVSDTTQKYYNSNGDIFKQTRECPAASWYYEFRDSGKEVAANAAVDVDSNNMPMIFINCKISGDEGEFIGATGVGIKFRTLPRLLEEYKMAYNRNIFFAHASGEIIASSSDLHSGLTNVYDLFRKEELLDEVFTGKISAFEYTENDEVMLVNTRYLPELDRWLFIEHNQSDSLEKVNNVILLDSLINFISIVLTLVLVILAVNYSHKQLKQLATIDSLTGVHNRQVFDYTLEQAIMKFKRQRNAFGLLLVDIDHFKIINDTYGHIEGDKILKNIAQLIEKNIRSSDDFCRWGGEEFTVLVHDCSLRQAVELAEKIRVVVQDFAVIGNADISSITISIGVAEVDAEDTVTTLVGRADKALYKAKESGRNCVKFGE